MSDFTFTSTTECNECGAYLSSSDENCDHGGEPVNRHVFRKILGERDSLTGVRSTESHKWNALEEKVGGDWKQYEWLGTKDYANSMLTSTFYDSVSDLPRRATAFDAEKEI